jgi:hypothetical protein
MVPTAHAVTKKSLLDGPPYCHRPSIDGVDVDDPFSVARTTITMDISTSANQLANQPANQFLLKYFSKRIL